MQKVLVTVLAIFLASPGHQASAEGPGYSTATFAGGCFWCMEPPFEKLPGVVSVVSGYTGGKIDNPTYEQVSSGSTGHVEAVQVTYDPARISYERLLEVYWHQIDPTDAGGQFVDRGRQYRSVVFFHDTGQKNAADRSKKALEGRGIFRRSVVTEILPAGRFFRAEEYHQDYYRKNPVRYRYYRGRSGRDSFLEKAWSDDKPITLPRYDRKGYVRPTDEALRKMLTPLQYRVVREEGTERPFDNTYWNNRREGIYVDLVSGEPLFSSRDKYDSGTGWPSFKKPIDPGSIVLRKDRGLLAERTEVRSSLADSHLGHVFDDGPAPTGKRYCINSAALRFIPKEDLEREGYGKHLKVFER